jgi:predicted O-methyltransferase YrrM
MPQLTPSEIAQKLIIPEWDTASPVKTEEACFLYDFLKEKKLRRTLEVGFAFAKSASHIMAATGERHLAMDPFQETYRGLGLQNVETLGLREQLDFRPDFSHHVLPQLAQEGRRFEFIFVDGDHKFDGILLDFYYADLLLEPNGYVLLHDTWMRSTQLVMEFIHSNRKDYRKVPTPLRNFALYQKVGTDSRNGMFFREFYTFRNFARHHLILWMTSGEQTALKRFALRAKDWAKRLMGG